MHMEGILLFAWRMSLHLIFKGIGAFLVQLVQISRLQTSANIACRWMGCSGSIESGHHGHSLKDQEINMIRLPRGMKHDHEQSVMKGGGSIRFHDGEFVTEEFSISFAEPQLSFNSMSCERAGKSMQPIAPTHRAHEKRLGHFLQEVAADHKKFEERVEERRGHTLGQKVRSSMLLLKR